MNINRGTAKRALIRGLTVVFGILVGIALTEAIARSVYSEPWYERLIAEQRHSLKIQYWENRFGFRDIEYPAVKPAHTHRILLLGDSNTFGLGVADGQNIFSELLKKRLSERNFGGNIAKVELLNAAIPGSVTDDWLAVVERFWTQFNPDTVVIVFFLRNGLRGQASIPAFFDKIRREFTKSNRESPLYRNSYAFRLIKDQLDKRRISSLYVAQYIEGYLGNEQQTADWAHNQTTLLKIRDYARQRSANVGFVILPILVQLDEHYPFQTVSRHIEAFAKRNGMPTLDLLTAFKGFQGPELWVSAYDQHPNARAHRMIAEALEPFVAGIVSGAGVRDTVTDRQMAPAMASSPSTPNR